ncbi:M4 family metallopeptidase [Streptomyces sp. NBC_01220]|uniref:M4 family metallopeptidase n=1 Tax=Streptomyces TaxID=1883 RepID=UPI001C5F7B45|nr:M4 family metallopeptidase [Streptomyces poriferorum]MBW5248320.1 M4 family metallopeptidase [Streptomyces poriferorum]MBW5255286.1 M4 family metallopeptidase [Streptomyces poriferorum]WSQ48056.1 M4 family metallopeptidase [Streptomyces sp. NBC_01220]
MIVGQGIAAVLAAAGLLVTAIPAAHADTAPASASSDVTPGAETETPSLVTDLNEPVAATGSAADAARSHLKAKKSRYHIADPAGDLKVVDTQAEGGRETVRLQQKYKGVTVMGGEYVVRMEKKSGKRAVTGTSGKFFTQLKLDTVAPKVSEKTAIERAVSAVGSQLSKGGLLKAPAKGEKPGAQTLTGTAEGVTILPQGTGVLTRQITVTGISPVDGQPVKQQVYIDAHSGFPVMQYSDIKTFGATSATASATGETGKAPEASTAAADQLVVKGTGTRYNGEKVELNLYKDTKGALQMRDYGRRAADSPYEGPMLVTYDARGREVSSASGNWPTGVQPFSPATPELGEEYTNSGAVDAHWAAGKVYDYYKSHFDRKGLDGNDGFIYSLVGVVQNGQPYNNAFWDGQKMVYGQGGGDFRTFSADTDVVGHEMTHGVVEHTANLVYAGQSGAMNEALADYFGNAIDLEANHVSMDDPDAGLLGEDLCTTLSPRDCALRDLNDGATTSKNFIGATYGGDNGGVHLNSTIFSGALWDMRQDLGGELADQIVYRALSAYMTPLDGFTEGRAAVIAAAKELGVTKAQLNTVKKSFDAHGIVPGWEKALGVDTDTILNKVNIAGTGVGAGGGKYAVSNSNEDGSEPYSVWLGNTSGKGQPQLVSANNGDYNVYANTDGKTVVWADYSSTGIRIMARPVKGGLAKMVDGIGSDVSSLVVDGDWVAYTAFNPQFGVTNVRYVNMKTGEVGLVDGGRPYNISGLPSIKDGKIAYAKVAPDANGNFNVGVEVFDGATGAKTQMPVADSVMGIGQTAITDDGVFWIEDDDATDTGKAAVRRANLDGSNPVTVTPEAGEGSLYAYTLTASDDAVSITATPPATWWANDTMAKLYQVSPDGKGGPQRMSCNRGEQAFGTADEGQRVLWLDGTTGYTNLVKRDRPAGRC